MENGRDKKYGFDDENSSNDGLGKQFKRILQQHFQNSKIKNLNKIEIVSDNNFIYSKILSCCSD